AAKLPPTSVSTVTAPEVILNFEETVAPDAERALRLRAEVTCTEEKLAKLPSEAVSVTAPWETSMVLPELSVNTWSGAWLTPLTSTAPTPIALNVPGSVGGGGGSGGAVRESTVVVADELLLAGF